MDNTNYAKANIGKRFIAYLIDMIVGLVIPIGIATFIAILESVFNVPCLLYLIPIIAIGVKLREVHRQNSQKSYEIILLLMPLGYFFAKDGFNNGQSYGKKYMGLMVVDLVKNEPCTRSNSSLRQLVFLLLCILCGAGILIEALVGMIQNEGRRLGDFAAKTQVIELFEYKNAKII